VLPLDRAGIDDLLSDDKKAARDGQPALCRPHRHRREWTPAVECSAIARAVQTYKRSSYMLKILDNW
jgi:hypothetical protein